jgi:CRISPR-associated protein Csm5
MNSASAIPIPNGQRERRPLDLQVVSPVHIGTREGRLISLEFVFHDQTTHIIDEGRLGKLLHAKGLVDQFVSAAGSGPLSMGQFLKSHVRSPIDEILKQICSTRIPGGDVAMFDFRPFVRDGQGTPYIPGSSIKGALRTAILHGILHADPTKMDIVVATTDRNLGRLKGGYGAEKAKRGFSADWLQKQYLQRFFLPSTEAGPNQDLLRCVTVRDAYPVGNVRTGVIRIRYLSKSKQGGFNWSSNKRTGKPLEIWLEAALAGVFRTEVLWDHALFKQFQKHQPEGLQLPVRGLDDLFKHVGTMNEQLLAHEKVYCANSQSQKGGLMPESEKSQEAARHLAGWYGQLKGSLFRVGFGSGMLSTTVNIMFDEALRQRIRNTCGHDRGDEPAPKTRRIWQQPNGQWLPMGWLRMHHGPMSPEPERETAAQALTQPQRPAASRPIMRARPDLTDKVDYASLSQRAQTVSLQDRLNLQRVVAALDEIEDAEQAAKIARLLKLRFEQAGVWRQHPLRKEIELFL